MPLNLILYSTSQCHLCELAESLLITYLIQHQIKWEIVEISDDVALLEKYELKIPVLKRIDNEIEINWPFNIIDIENLLSK